MAHLSKIIKRKYKYQRNAFKNALYEIMKDNLTLALLVQQIHIGKREHDLLYEVFEITGFRHKDAYKEICQHNIPTRMYEGSSHRLFNQLYFVDKDLYIKYAGTIPEKYAMGDAYAIATRVFREYAKKV